MEVGAIDPEAGGRLGHIPARGLQRLADRLDFAALDFAPQSHRLLARRAGLEPRAQVLGPHLITVHQDRGALHQVPELAHVARPMVALEQRDRFVGQALRRLLATRGELLKEMAAQDRDVRRALPQRGHVDGEHVQAIEEVLSEASGLDR